MKDVLKRMNSIAVDGKMSINSTEYLTVANDLFQQEVPLEKCKNGTEGIAFKVSIPVLNSLILGSDDMFSSDLFIYFVETSRSYVLYIQDTSGAWFSSMQASKM